MTLGEKALAEWSQYAAQKEWQNMACGRNCGSADVVLL